MMAMTKYLAILALVSQTSAFTVVTQSRSNLSLHALPFDPASFTESSGLLDKLISLPLDPAGIADSAGADGLLQDKIPIIAAAVGMSLSFFIAGSLGKSSKKKGGSAVGKAGKPEPKPLPVDLSIPYDAASLLAYKQWKDPFFFSQQEGREKEFDDALYQQFKRIYKTKTVAAMKLKKVQRDTAEILSKADKDLAALME